MTDESSPPPVSLALLEERFERLIDEIREKPADVHLLVAINPSHGDSKLWMVFIERRSWWLLGLD